MKYDVLINEYMNYPVDMKYSIVYQ